MSFSRRDILGMAASAWASTLLGRAERIPTDAQLIWREPRDPGEILRYGPVGRMRQPKAPFRFEEEDMGGSNPKIKVRDASGTPWIVKWGKEVHSEAFASRLAACAGYFVRTAIYMPNGQIEDCRGLGRAKDCVDSAGRFENAVMKLIALDQPYMAGANWTWTNNPFLTRADELRRLNGLKVIMMLASNWDNKDASFPDAGVNTAIYEEQSGTGTNYLYAFDDWGATMGRWGGVAGRSKWDAQGYAQQTPEFLLGRGPNGFLEWGFNGKAASEIKTGIRPEDVEAVMRFFNGVGRQELAAGLNACGATPAETALFTDALLERFSQLRRVAA